MKQQGNFLLLERSEFKDWLDKQNASRKITTLQVHHTYLPNYSTRKNQDPFKCLEGMRNSHLKQGWSATGQHFSVLETGQIGVSLDRSLNTTPAGIKGANTGAICVEIVGNFDVGGDTMLETQKQSVIHLYACLANKFNLPIDTEHIVYHHWYSSEGIKIVDFKTGKSISKLSPSKTCPGTNFWGNGNTVEVANKGFIPDVKAELERLRNPIVATPTKETAKDEDQMEKVKDILTKDNSVHNGFIKDNENYVSISVLKALGHKVSWDNVNKKLYIS